MRLIIAALSGFVLASCASAPEPASPSPAPSAARDLIAAGRALVETRCVGCHAVGVEGESRLAEAPPLRRLSESYPVTALEEAFAEGILVGHPAMPEFHFSPEEIDAIVAYLESIQTRQGG